jgi:hypothetical protein
MLGHLETRDLVEVTLLLRNFAVVHAEDTALGLWDVVGTETLVAELGLVFGEGNWG